MSSPINIQTSKKVIPMIYAYSTPEIKRHDGWTKIGYTEQDVDKRLGQQTHTADVEYKEEWRGNAIFEDGSGETFKDIDFHAYLRRNEIEQEPGKNNEWFHITGDRSEKMFFNFRRNRGVLETTATIPYTLRTEQKEAVSRAKDYFLLNENGEFLWNAKPRFGKTLSVYDLCKQLDAHSVLVVTNRPAIANSWYSDFCKFLGEESGYRFISEVNAIKDKPHTISREIFDKLRESEPNIKCVEFMSLQNLKGSLYVGGKYDKLRYVTSEKWDLLVIDEAHEGIDTYKTDVAFDHIKRRWTLHLSGTPFKALANEKFKEDAIYNWTYADEQTAKRDYQAEPGTENPYGTLPRLCMYTYQMSQIVEGQVRQGIVIDENEEEYAFDLNEFFSINKAGRFVHEEAVDRFLDALTTQGKFPFSTEDLRRELKHTLWLLNRVDSAKALYRKLSVHPVFKDYEIILAAGDGKTEDDESVNTNAFKKVTDAIKKCDKTITLSVGQLTTGITIPEWTAVLMLSNVKSPSLYMQAAFRAQNPCLSQDGVGGYFRKENAYVFDFDPARTLEIFEKFANDLSADTSAGKGDMDSRKAHVRVLLNFFPVLGEDEEGRMIELDAEKVLSIPRKIRSIEVVRRGFMSDYLFQNISNIFHAPTEVWDLINRIEPIEEPPGVVEYYVGDLDLDQEGEISIPREKVIGTATALFGDKIYAIDEDQVDAALDSIHPKSTPSEKERQIEQLLEAYKVNVTAPLMDKAKEKYGPSLTPSATKSLERKLNTDAETKIRKDVDDLQIMKKSLEVDKEHELDASRSDAERKEIEARYKLLEEEKTKAFKQAVNSTLDDLIKSGGEDIVEKVESDIQNAKKKSVEDAVRDHLRGFSRTIPSFLMAYGSDGEITLSNFDTLIPEEVFKDVTSITLDEFRFLRDGGDYVDEGTGETKSYEGHLFDPVVFDDSVKEFLALKKRLADYFDEDAPGDIFDYIPPQKTNQIFTPKTLVKDMVDRLEQENPGCFDDETKTFADLYMKSGLYLAEIVKRLYRSKRLKQLYPNEKDRLNHIFSKQVYGLAPTEIIYNIVLSFLLGFSDEITIEKHNIRLCDAQQYAKDNTLEDKLKEIYEM